MNFKEFKYSLRFKNYKQYKIFFRFFEYKLKNLIFKFLIKFNFTKKNKPFLNLGNYYDSRFINFLFYALKKDFHFVYEKSDSTILFLKKIGIFNFFKHTCEVTKIKNDNDIFKLSFNNSNIKENINFNTNYFEMIKNNHNKEKVLIMPYYVYPEVYNFYYNKIKISKNYLFKIFFSGSVYQNVYANFNWENNYNNSQSNYLSRIEIINIITKEFKNEIFFIKKKNDLKNNDIFKKRIIFSLYDRMISKKKYFLNFRDNYNLLSKSAFNLNCPGAVMPICHHTIEGIKLGSIPITSCNNVIYPPLNNDLCLTYKDKESLICSFDTALKMKDDEIKQKKIKLIKFYNKNFSPQSFKNKFISNLNIANRKEIIACNDHESVERYKKNKVN